MEGGGGLGKLREGLEAENAVVQVPADIRWLGGAKVRARFQRAGCGGLSVVAAVLGETVFNRLCKRGVRLPGGHYEVDAFEEERPDALAYGVVSGVMLPPTAMRPRSLGAQSARRSTLRGTTDARLRAVGWEEAACARM